jgi:septal ring factor EnvC (AmiA/AmiB activator)
MRKGHFKLARSVDEKLSASDKTNKGLREKINSQANQIQRLETQIALLRESLTNAERNIVELDPTVVELNQTVAKLRALMILDLADIGRRIKKLESAQRYPILIPRDGQ